LAGLALTPGVRWPAGQWLCCHQYAAAAATLTWLILEAVLRGKPTAVGAATGAVAGLVSDTSGGICYAAGPLDW